MRALHFSFEFFLIFTNIVEDEQAWDSCVPRRRRPPRRAGESWGLRCRQEVKPVGLAPLHPWSTSLRYRLTLTLIVVVQLLSPVRLCDPKGCTTRGFPVLHCLPEFGQTHID